VEIRLATPGDGAAVQGIYAPVVATTPISFELEPPSVEEMATRIAGVLPTYPWLVLTEGKAVLGYAYARRYQERPAYRWSVESSVYVGAEARGSGAGGALYRSLFAVLAAQGYRQAVGGVALPNPASWRLHESSGFTLTGVQRRIGWKFGTWHDVAWWQRELIPGTGAPSLPVSVDRLPAEVLAAALGEGIRFRGGAG
jgi:L-amino acid N-acyltransferase YncA